VLAIRIKALTKWTRNSVRVSIERDPWLAPLEGIKPDPKLIEINRVLALKVASECGNRFFGNVSTRCTKLFPSMKKDTQVLVSARNTNKETLTADDFVLVSGDVYYGDKKPSVDTPLQLEIYKRFPDIRYMIHGHAFVQGAQATEKYFPCGDMRELGEVVDFLIRGQRIINLKRHGFLIVASSLVELKRYATYNNFFGDKALKGE
jgi:hypothetical protein